MSAMEAKVRCPKCHFRFFVPLAEIGHNGTTPCPNCNTPIPVKTKVEAAAPKARAPVASPNPEPAAAPLVAAPLAVAAPAAAPPARPWWKFWAR